jgi:hypothetical protein
LKYIHDALYSGTMFWAALYISASGALVSVGPVEDIRMQNRIEAAARVSTPPKRAVVALSESERIAAASSASLRSASTPTRALPAGLNRAAPNGLRRSDMAEPLPGGGLMRLPPTGPGSPSEPPNRPVAFPSPTLASFGFVRRFSGAIETLEYCSPIAPCPEAAFASVQGGGDPIGEFGAHPGFSPPIVPHRIGRSSTPSRLAAALCLAQISDRIPTLRTMNAPHACSGAGEGALFSEARRLPHPPPSPPWLSLRREGCRIDCANTACPVLGYS